MPVSAVVDTVIGLSFAFFVLSLAASAVAEWVATVLQKRSKYLLRGLRAMLEGTPEDADGGTTRFWTAAHAERAITREALRVLDGTRPSAADGTPLARLLRHPLIAAQAQRRAGGSVTRPPSYLAASTVAAAVLDEFVGDDPSAMLEGRVAANALPEPLSTTLTALARQADGSVTAFASAVEAWYDAQMARVSGYYKRWIKRWILVIAAVLVLVLHIDALSMAGTLWHDPEVRQAAVALAARDTSGSTCDAQKTDQQAYLACLNTEAEGLRTAGLTVGPPAGCAFTDIGACLLPQRAAPYTPRDVVAVIAGLLLSVLAASLGAPFWFQVLTRLASLRNTGDKPAPGS
jgi:hypothetical protein